MLLYHKSSTIVVFTVSLLVCVKIHQLTTIIINKIHTPTTYLTTPKVAFNSFSLYNPKSAKDGLILFILQTTCN